MTAWRFLSGPSFAVEVARKLPTVVTVASPQPGSGPDPTQQVFATPYFRVYTSKDIIGVELWRGRWKRHHNRRRYSSTVSAWGEYRAALITARNAEIRRLGKRRAPTLELTG